MTDQERSNLFLEHVPGKYEYRCRVKNGDTFEDGDISRGGVIYISASMAWFGLKIGIDGFRLWHMNSQEEQFALKIPLVWKAKASLREMDNDQLEFSYSNMELFQKNLFTGNTVDVFQLDTTKFEFFPGSFTHTRTDNKVDITGVVTLRKMRDNSDFLYAPENMEFN